MKVTKEEQLRFDQLRRYRLLLNRAYKSMSLPGETAGTGKMQVLIKPEYTAHVITNYPSTS